MEVEVYEPDPDTIAAARGGDAPAFGRIVSRYQADAIRLATHLIRDRTLAEDAVQEAFVRAFRFMRRYRGDSRFSTWLFTIVRNCALDEARKAGKRSRLERTDRDVHDPETPHLALEIRDALGTLPLELREAVLLIDMMGASYREVSRVLRIPEGTVKSRVHRARHMLVEILEPRLESAADES